MSRAFVKENDDIEPLPERPVSSHPNLVTERGLSLIEEELARASAAYADAQARSDRDALGKIGRDLRYWQQRRASAQAIRSSDAATDVRFGCSVTIKREDGRRQTWRIVGEDEAEPAKGSISYVAPVARALMGKSVGDVVTVGQTGAEILAIA